MVILLLIKKKVAGGFIDCHTHLGIIEEGTGKIGIDNNEKSDPITPHLRGIDAIKSGITTVMSGPGSGNAVGENPITTYRINSKCPVTRMGTAALIRELFLRAQDYADNKNHNKISERNLRLEAVLPVLEGKIPLRAHAHRADDIVTAMIE